MTANSTLPRVSVVVPTHNPRMDYLRRVLEALRGQTLEQSAWELVVVDNGSREPLKAGMEHTAEGIQLEDRSQRSEIGEQRSDARQGDLKLKNLKRKAAEKSVEQGVGSAELADDKRAADVDLSWHGNARIVREEKLGLTFARLRGFAEAKGELIVMVDDDNLLDPDYLANAVRIAEEHKELGAFGGKCLPEFESEPEPWMEEFLPLLALRDHGDKEIIAGDTRSADGSRRVYPDQAAPIGAGMVLRSSAARAYAERLRRGNEGWESEKWKGDGSAYAFASAMDSGVTGAITDRKGDSLASAGDNDLVFTILRDGWKVGYFPQLHVTHLIPSNRLTVDYLARANRGVQRSWVEVLRKHEACPWPTITSWSLPLRKVKAWALQRPWRHASAKISLAGVIGRLEGRA